MAVLAKPYGLGFTTLLSTVCLLLTATTAQAQRKSCEERKNVLGISRIIEIDTSNGALLGNQQYKAIDFLEPGEVVLTFDDGPLRKNTLRVLNALEAHCTKATFFMVGRMAVADPQLVREIDRRGHTVGTHTWSHKNLKRLSSKSAKNEIELGISAVSAALGRPVAPFFRFPYLADTNGMIEHLNARGVGTFSIDGDSYDYRTRSGPTMKRQTFKALKRRGKGILLFHDIQKSTARGIMSVLSELRDGGYKVVHIVPKGQSTTLKSYDQRAARHLFRRTKSGNGYPLAKGAVPWPISSPIALAEIEPLKNKGPYVPKRRSRKKKKASDELPWQNDEGVTEQTKKKKPAKKKRKIVNRRKNRRPVQRRPLPSYDPWALFP